MFKRSEPIYHLSHEDGDSMCVTFSLYHLPSLPYRYGGKHSYLLRPPLKMTAGTAGSVDQFGTIARGLYTQ